MQSASLDQLVEYCDRVLQPGSFTDWPGAVNGLQVENGGVVTRIAAAVDGTLATIRKAAEVGANLLIVHHGLFWSPSHPWTGKRYELIRFLVDNQIAVYSSHLPLDAHRRLGNNAQLCGKLGLRKLEPFFFEKGAFLGFKASTKITRVDLGQKLANVLGAAPTILPGGPSICRKIGIVTGGAGEQLKLAASEGVDTFITGEGPHWTFALAEDLGLNVFYGGHYGTETFGVKALAAELSRKFNVPWSFIDHPTGL